MTVPTTPLCLATRAGNQRDPAAGPPGPRRTVAGSLVLMCLTLVGFGLRASGLDSQPLWGDEGWSYYFASMPLPEMLALTARDIHPPLYYALLHAWLQITGGAPEAARLLSVVFGTLLVPAVHRLTAVIFGRRAGLGAAAVAAVAPMAVYYAQEVRMYGLVTLLALASVFFLVRLMRRRTDRIGTVAYVAATAAALYSMYFAVFVVAAQALWLLVQWLARRTEWPRVRRAGLAMMAAGLLYVPWVIYAGGQLATYVQGKRVAEGYLPLDPLHYLAAHLATFSMGHVSDSLAPLAAAATLFAVLVALGLFGGGRRPLSTVLPLCYLLVPLAGGFLVNMVYPFTPRYFERTLLLAAPAWWLLTGAGLAWLWQRRRVVVGAAASGVILAISVVSLIDFYSVPRYRDEDYRPLLSYMRTHSTSDDVILASYQWQLGLYHAYLPSPHPVFFVVPGWGEGWADHPERMQADLQTLIYTHPRLWFPAYQSLGRLWETQVEAILNEIAYPTQVDWNLPGTKLTLYGGAGGVLAPVEPIGVATGQGGTASFAGLLALDEVLVGRDPVEAGRGILPVALTWRQLSDGAADCRVALQVVDAAGRSWAGRDSLPGGGQRSFARLPSGQRIEDRHGVLIPAGTPPGEYRLRLSLVDAGDERPLDVLDAAGQPLGSAVDIGPVQVVLPETMLAAEALPIQHALRANFAGGIRLLGYSLGATPSVAGETLSFSLFWQAVADQAAAYVVFAQLQAADGHPLALSEAPPAYPADRWRAGMLLRDPRQIPLPPELPAGEYRLAIGLLRPDGARVAVNGEVPVSSQGADQVILASVTTTQRPHLFEPPTPVEPWHLSGATFGNHARLVAYQLDDSQPVAPGESLPLVLHWQALAPFSRRYTVFVHLVDSNDRIYGQQDQEPGSGRFPTTGWLDGEYLTDEYRIPVNPETPPGTYYVEVGLYDPQDGTRLPVFPMSGAAADQMRLLLRTTPIQVH